MAGFSLNKLLNAAKKTVPRKHINSLNPYRFDDYGSFYGLSSIQFNRSSLPGK